MKIRMIYSEVFMDSPEITKTFWTEDEFFLEEWRAEGLWVIQRKISSDGYEQKGKAFFYPWDKILALEEIPETDLHTKP